jgi:hypothetical protein
MGKMELIGPMRGGCFPSSLFWGPALSLINNRFFRLAAESEYQRKDEALFGK